MPAHGSGQLGCRTIAVRATRPRVNVSHVGRLGQFTFRWPAAVEEFEEGWAYEVHVAGETHGVRHGLGGREVYGRIRVHTATWLDSAVQVEGVEADDYPTTQALLSFLRRDDRKHVRHYGEVPAGYEKFEVVEHRREIDAPWGPFSLAVKIREDDLERPGQRVNRVLRGAQLHQGRDCSVPVLVIW